MAFNIVSAVARYLTPEVVGKIATASGLNGSVAQGAVNAAVPAILSALTSVVDKPGGARKLADAVAEQPADLLTSLASKLTGSAQMASQGSSLLSSLLGGSTSSVLAATVSKFLGIGEGPMQTVMGLLAPVIMGVVGGQQRAANLDANSLARLLTGQKDQIADAMPAGLSQALNKDGIGSTENQSIALTTGLVWPKVNPVCGGWWTILAVRAGRTGLWVHYCWEACSGLCCRAPTKPSIR